MGGFQVIIVRIIGGRGGMMVLTGNGNLLFPIARQLVCPLAHKDLLHVEAEMHDITILYFIFFAFYVEQSSFAHG